MRPHSPQPPGARQDVAGGGCGTPRLQPTAPASLEGAHGRRHRGKKKKKRQITKRKKQVASRVSISAPWQLAQGVGLGLTAAEIWVAQRWAGHPALLAHGHFQELDFWLSQHPATGCWGWLGAPPRTTNGPSPS